ncbi:hypothetical protein WJX75_005754 [Coccomyxa subellipsoidea]|uniref:BZIP domain-containing protein n=1 Tax=Coccomyxa subellipsoidea TaxID=248742 RepID=A0ABR2YW88_9CHLO
MPPKDLLVLPPIVEIPLLEDEALKSPRSQDSDFLHFLVELDGGAQELAPTGSAITLHGNKERSESPDFFAAGICEPDLALSRAGSYLSVQQQTSLVPTPWLTFTAGAQPPAVWPAPGLFYQGGHGEGERGGVQDSGHCTAPPTHCLASQVSGVPLQMEKAFPSAATSCGPLLSGSDTSNAGGESPGKELVATSELQTTSEEAGSCSIYEEQSTSVQEQTGSPTKKKSHKTDNWREKNKQHQKAYRKRQKERAVTTELGIFLMSEQATDLENEIERLRKAIQSTTRLVKRAKPAPQDRNKITVAVAWGEGDAPMQLTTGELQAFTVHHMALIWRGLVRNMAVCLPEAEHQPQGRHARRSEVLSAEACALMWAMMDLNPAVMASFLSCDLEQPTQPRCTTLRKWSCILDRLQLSPEQRLALANTRRALLANVGVLLAERKQLVAQAEGVAWVGGIGSSDLEKVVEQMRSNSEAIQLCTFYYISDAYNEILTPLQCARFFHQCYPFGPDILSLMAVAAAAADEPRVQQLLPGQR